MTNDESLQKRCQEQRDEIRLLRLFVAELVSRLDGTVTIDLSKVGKKEVYIR